eukprot:TRINITY_DN24424_c0_g1_i2.p1 TRINITY_DN24424_c0_g1~~TRINITY_DN24424_c0_g1_i2.p1  ORF type:complete len:274 (-),score=86.85 TRINITY_DN24424_c0_g1_i2:112-933(-)
MLRSLVGSEMCIRDRYATAEYWDNRYQVSGEEVYDWHHTFDGLSPLLVQVLKPEHKILVLGCGNATFSEDMHAAGFEQVTNVDISRVCIEKMRARDALAGRHMRWEVMDVCALGFESNEFDVVIDKATGDSIVCMDDGHQKVLRMLQESCRVLKVGGTFVMVSAQASVQAQVHDESLPWKSGEMKIPTALFNKDHALGTDEITLILCKKKRPANMTEKDARFWQMVMMKVQTKKEARAKLEAEAAGRAEEELPKEAGVLDTEVTPPAADAVDE